MKRDAIGIALVLAGAIGTMALLHDRGTVGLVVWLVAYGLLVAQMVRVALRQRSLAKRLGTYITARLILVLGLSGPLLAEPLGQTWPGWAVLLVAIALSSAEPRLASVARRNGIRVENLDALHAPRVQTGPPKAMIICQMATLPVLAVLGFIGVPAPYWPLVVLPAVVATAVVVAAALARRALVRQVRRALTGALTEIGPRFAVYWDAPAGSGYQLGMWMPYLHRIGEPFVVLVRNSVTFDDAVKVADGAPVVLARTMADLERCVVPTLRAAFYVNNAARNGHFVRYGELTHVQLLHGDSDKPPSFNPVTAMFDKVFVAGQAGIDRYAAHGVHIPAHKFAIVGRPQVESIEPRGADRSTTSATTVLYAPTWRGQHADAAYSSLANGPALVEMLLARGCAVLFRPHPYSHRDPEHRELIRQINARLDSDTGPARESHRHGEAMAAMSLTECFNTCDAMVADISSVVVDFLQSEKPMAIARGDQDAATFLAQFPAAAAAYLLDADPATWGTALDAMLGDDPMAQERTRMRKHYLGDLPRDGYAEAFLTAARRVVTAPEVTGTAPVPTPPHEEAGADPDS